MKIKEKFADRFTEYDKRLMEALIKKEKNSLKKELIWKPISKKKKTA